MERRGEPVVEAQGLSGAGCCMWKGGGGMPCPLATVSKDHEEVTWGSEGDDGEDRKLGV